LPATENQQQENYSFFGCPMQISQKPTFLGAFATIALHKEQYRESMLSIESESGALSLSKGGDTSFIVCAIFSGN